MNLISRLVPTNLLSEKEKFFADEKYQPQFTYEEPISESELQNFGVPQKKYVDLAKTILQKTYHHRNEADLFMMEGRELTQAQVTHQAEVFLKAHHLEKRFQIIWSSSFVSRASITEDTLKIRLPVDFRQEGLTGMLYHEVGTHALRRLNYEKQLWYKQKKKRGFQDYLRTEEGLAALNALVPHSFPSSYIQAIRYLAVHFAQTHSFVELWHLLKPYIEDPERRWNVTFRQKRGLTDTSQPGGYTKDLVYFEGLVEVWQWLATHDFDPSLLYWGKHAWQDVDKALEMNPHFKPLLPKFYTHDVKGYQKAMSEIGKFNLMT